MSLVRGQNYFFITDAEYTALGNQGVYGDIYRAFSGPGDTVMIDGTPYHYASYDSIYQYVDTFDEYGDFYDLTGVDLDYGVYLSAANITLYPYR